MAKKKKRGGCIGLLPMTAFACGALGCAWSFYLGQTQAGQEVSLTTGATFYLGWLCGMTLVGLGVLIAIVQSILGAAVGAANKIGDGADGLADIIPGAGALGGLGLIQGFFSRERD